MKNIRTLGLALFAGLLLMAEKASAVLSIYAKIVNENGTSYYNKTFPTPGQGIAQTAIIFQSNGSDIAWFQVSQNSFANYGQIQLGSPQGQRLAVGTYTGTNGAQRTSPVFVTSAYDVGDGHGTQAFDGFYGISILQIEYNTAGTAITAFAADITQVSANSASNVMESYRYNSPIPPSPTALSSQVPEPSVLITTTLAFAFGLSRRRR